MAVVTKWEMLAATNQMQGENERQWKKVNENTYYISSWWGCAALFSKSDPISDQTSKIHTRFQTWPLGRNYVIVS